MINAAIAPKRSRRIAPPMIALTVGAAVVEEHGEHEGGGEPAGSDERGSCPARSRGDEHRGQEADACRGEQRQLRREREPVDGRALDGGDAWPIDRGP